MASLSTLDYSIIIGFFILSLLIGLWTSKTSGKNTSEFFLSGRNMPWWLLGVSMVATTFAADTPGLVTELVRNDGVSGNWVWWAMLLTGMLTVFFYAKLWRKSGITTDLEFYELRYSGKAAGFLRGFRAIYLGVIFNVITMAGVCLAGAKIASILLNISQAEMLLYSSIIVVIYSSLGGLKGVLITDFIQFLIAMIGSVWATIYIVNLPEIGGLESLITHENVTSKLDILPDFSNTESLITLLIIPFAVQWWSTWYPGAEPGGGGYIAQRMLAAKDEKNATWATLFFNFAHYALRPWPWIIVGLASIYLYPLTINDTNKQTVSAISSTFLNEKIENNDIEQLIGKAKNEAKESKNYDLVKRIESNPNTYQVKSLSYLYKKTSKDYTKKDVKLSSLESLVSLQIENPKLPVDKLGGDVAYATLLKKLPPGLIGIVLLSLIAAFMSTISTQLNWGSSYIVNDFYSRFINNDASEKQKVIIGRISTVVLMIFAALFSFYLQSAKDVFNLLLQIGAGTGLLFILRWFWHRINPYSEIAAMAISFIIALVFFINKKLDFALFPEIKGYWQLIIGVVITTIGWVIVTLTTQPTNKETLAKFNQLIFGNESKFKNINYKIAGFFIATIGIYCFLFATGYFLYAKTSLAIILTVISLVCTVILIKIWKKIA